MARDVEVVITGMGLVSPIGIGVQPFWESLRGQRSGVRPLRALAPAELPVPFGGEVIDFDGKQFITPRKSLKVMCREIQFGVSAATMALADAGLASGSVDPDRLGVIYGAEMHYGELEELVDVYQSCIEGGVFNFDRWGERMSSALFPLWMLKYLPNMTACHVGISHDARGPNNSIVLGDASSLLAILEGYEILRRGHADVMVCGGTGSRLNLTSLAYRGYSDQARADGEIAQVSCPFDARRRGIVNGEGAAAFILETRRHAEARGATLQARLLGGGMSCETQPGGTGGTGICNSIRLALQQSGLAPGELGHVNAHGLGTLAHDAAEAQAIQQLLGEVPVTALKSYFGNLGAGGGAVEMAASVLAFTRGEIPVTLNYEQPDPQCPIRVVHGEPQPLGTATALVLSQSGTGQTAALVLAGV